MIKQGKDIKYTQRVKHWLQVDNKTMILVDNSKSDTDRIKEWDERKLSEYSKFNKNVK